MKQCSATIVIATLAMSVLTGCQTTVSNSTSNYQGRLPDDRTYTRADVARVRTDLAAQYIAERKLDMAKNQLETAMEADNRYAPAYDMMGVLLQTEGSPANLAKADGFFKRAINLDSNFTQAYNNYGVYLAMMGKDREAIKNFEKAGSTLGYEGRTKALENLGLTYKKLGDTKNAKESFIRAIEANTGTVVGRIELIDISLAEGNSLVAKRLYDELVGMAGNYDLPARVMLQGVKIAISQGDRVQQQRLAQQILSTHPLSNEAKRLKQWLQNPNKPLK